MGMKPRLNDGPVSFEGLANQAKRVPENGDLPNSNLSSCTKNQGPGGAPGFDNLSSKVKPA